MEVRALDSGIPRVTICPLYVGLRFPLYLVEGPCSVDHIDDNPLSAGRPSSRTRTPIQEGGGESEGTEDDRSLVLPRRLGP